MSSSLTKAGYETGHFAHFYGRVEDHVEHVAGFLAETLSSDGRVLIVARRRLREQLWIALSARGVDVDRATSSRLLVDLDAEDLLAQIQRPDGLDLDAFDVLIGAALRDASADRELRAYGELVSLLWEAGDVQGAIDIEDRWVRLGDEIGFSLMCGYDAGSMSSGQIDGFHDLCARHSEVVGAPPDIEGAERERRFPGTPAAVRAARRFVAEALIACGLTDLVEDATLVVGELATNAVMHAQSDFNVGVSTSRSAVRLSVSDALPRFSPPSANTIGGRGMNIVDALTGASGHDFVAGGKVVWAEFVLAVIEPTGS